MFIYLISIFLFNAHVCLVAYHHDMKLDNVYHTKYGIPDILTSCPENHGLLILKCCMIGNITPKSMLTDDFVFKCT